MNAPPDNRRHILLVLILAFSVVALAISNESFWIDEAAAASKAIQPSLHDWARQMREQAGSDIQMPLYMSFLWVWQQIGGSSEWYLRLGNAPWFLLGFVPFCRRHWTLALVCATSSFIWFYLDEARPYTMQVGATLLLAACFRRITEETERLSLWNSIGLAAGLVILSGSSLIGMLWAGGAVLAIGIALPGARIRTELRKHIVLWMFTTVLLSGFAGYYLWTLKSGARASSAASTDFRNVLYSIYELLGFGGLGPNRLEIRYGGFKSVREFAIPLAAYAGLAIGIAVVGLRPAVSSVSKRALMGVVIGAGLVTLFIFATGYKTHFRVLPRHLTPLIVLWFVIAAEGARLLCQRGHIARLVVIGFLALSLLGSLQQRFSIRHRKDDYRGAAAMAMQAAAGGKNVWWTADWGAALYYHVPKERVTLVVNEQPDRLQRLLRPGLVVLSKPEMYDYNEAIARYLQDHGFRVIDTLPAFTFWAGPSN